MKEILLLITESGVAYVLGWKWILKIVLVMESPWCLVWLKHEGSVTVTTAELFLPLHKMLEFLWRGYGVLQLKRNL
jgi:hypothetical protein